MRIRDRRALARPNNQATTGAPTRKVTPDRLRRLLYWLTQDWIHLSRALPTPASQGGRSSNVKEYGHPAEWASDQCRQIADLFWEWHNLVATDRGETLPTPMCSPQGRRIRTERQVIVAAWKYLEPRLEWMLERRVPVSSMTLSPPWLWEWELEDDAFSELFELHNVIRRRTGHATIRHLLPLPCPKCEMLTLVRRRGMDTLDFIICDQCGYYVADDHYDFLVTLMLDTQMQGR
ncbi:hypothetical protein SEA_BBQVALINDRA_65 [Gordonia phage BBQValindra]|nr:hypothetical protein SEA_BBQVALINDRA_65 [Gordonia phage BBQValindra]